MLSVFFLIVAAANIVLSFFISMAHGNVLAMVAFQAINFLVSLYLVAASIKASLVEVDGRRATWHDVWSNDARTYWRFVWTTILLVFVQLGITLVAGILFLAGFVAVDQAHSAVIAVAVVVGALFVAATLYASVRIKLANYSVVDGAPGMTGAGSIAESWRITRANFWRLLGFYIVIALVNLLGALVLIVGLLVTIPLTIVATAHVYRRLKSSAHEAVEVAPTSN